MPLFIAQSLLNRIRDDQALANGADEARKHVNFHGTFGAN
jgi:hypothetical protein